MGKLTKAQRAALEWFAGKSEPVKLFGVGDPGPRIRNALLALGWLSKHRPAYFGMIGYAITEAGRSALSAQGTET